MRAFVAFILGLALGPLSWAASYLASGTFEPFDSGTGFFVCQTVLVLGLLMVGLRAGLWHALLCLSGTWIGMNSYAYLTGGSETRAWIVLLLFSSLTLLLFPLAATLLGSSIHAVRKRRAGITTANGR
jgi:hypothetical protein